MDINLLLEVAARKCELGLYFNWDTNAGKNISERMCFSLNTATSQKAEVWNRTPLLETMTSEQA